LKLSSSSSSSSSHIFGFAYYLGGGNTLLFEVLLAEGIPGRDGILLIGLGLL
jgi:hypothetical protein